MMGKRESWKLCLVCLPGVSCLFCGHSSQCHGFVCSLWLWYFPIILTYYFWVSFMRTAMAFASLHICLVLSEPSSQFKILMWWLKWRLNANLCEQRMLWWVCTSAQAYLSHRHCTNSLVLPKMAICVLFTPAANTLVSLHICTGKVTRQCGKYLDLLCWQGRLLGVCTFAQARLSLRHSIEISCAGWNGDFCNVYVNSKCCGESALATTSFLCNHQCVVSMRQKMLPVRCNKNPQ